MGADTFRNLAMGATPGEAFEAAVEQAQYDYGHRGYTGSLAEKYEYVIISDKPGVSLDEAHALANKLMDEDDPRISDKWGPAGMIKAKDPGGADVWLIFGWASS